MAIIGFRPGLEIETIFQTATSTATPILSACIFGSAARVIRYSKTSEQSLGLLGTYDEDGDTDDSSWAHYAYPGKQPGDVPDVDFTLINVKNAFLQYFTVAAETVYANDRYTITHPDVNFKSNADQTFNNMYNGVTASPTAWVDRDVQVGDKVLIVGDSSAAGEFTLASYVTAIESQMSTSSYTQDVAASTNSIVHGSDGATLTPDGSNSGDISAVAEGGAYEGRFVGRMEETYTITVTRASTGGIATTALLQVISLSGTDNQLTVIPAAFASATNIGSRGLTVTFDQDSGDDFILGESWSVEVHQMNTIPALTIAGTFSATDQKDRTYLIEVIKGGNINSNADMVRVTEIRGLDVSRTFTLTGASTVANSIALGSYGVTAVITAATGLVYGDSWTIVATASKPTDYNILRLAHSLPALIETGDSSASDSKLTVTLFMTSDLSLAEKGVTSGQFNWVSSATEIKVASAVLIPDTGYTVAGVDIPLALVSPSAFTDPSQVYATTRLWVATDSALGSFSSSADIATLIPGPSDFDNPLKYALIKAALNGGGRTIYYFNVGDPTSQTNWDLALTQIEKNRDAYGLVPLTSDTAILDSVVAFAQSMAAIDVNMDKVVWVCQAELDSIVVADDTKSSDTELLLATIGDDPDTDGSQYTYVSLTSDNFGFTTGGVRASDELRINFATDAWGDASYETYVVDSVVNETTLKLVAGPASALGVARKIEIHRAVNAADFVTESNTRIAQYADFLVRYIPFGSVYDTKYVPSYFLASALAAIRGNLSPHQGMTRYPVSGFTLVKWANLLTEVQLNTLAGAGNFIVIFDDRTSRLLVRHGITAGDYENVNKREESIISNLHSIKFGMFDRLSPYIGQSNLTDQTMALIRHDIESFKTQLQSANASSVLGGQVIDMTILKLRQSPLAKDTLLIEVELTLPAPINIIRLTLFVK